MQKHLVVSPSRNDAPIGDSNVGEVKDKAGEKSGEDLKKASIEMMEEPQLAPVQSQEMDESMEKAAGAEDSGH